jgi:cell division protein FtsB
MLRKKSQWILILLGALALFLFWDFAQRAITFARLSDIERQDQAQLAVAQATQTALVEEKSIAQSDAYIEKTARSWGWVQSGDTLVRILTTPTPIPSAGSTPAPPSNPKSWLDLFRAWLGF